VDLISKIASVDQAGNAQGDRRNDAAQQQPARHAARQTRFNLPGWNRQQRAAQNFRRITGGAQRQRHYRATERIAQHRPEQAVAHHAELPQSVIDQK